MEEEQQRKEERDRGLPSGNGTKELQGRQTKHEQRAIPDSLPGRLVSWRRSYLERDDDLSFREDLINSSEKFAGTRSSLQLQQRSVIWYTV